MKKTRKILGLFLTLVLLLSMFSFSAQAEDYWMPDGTVTWLVPSSAGGGHDVCARTFAQCITNVTGVKIEVENFPNASECWTEAVLADPDGLTITTAASNFAIDNLTEPVIYGLDRVIYVGNMTVEAQMIVVNAKGPFANMSWDEFVEYARTHEVSVAVSGSWGTGDHVRSMIEDEYGFKFKRVGIKGGANCLLALIAGDVDCYIGVMAGNEGYIESGDVRPLMSAGEKRAPSAALKDVPTFIEILGNKNIYVPSAKIIVLPADTPDEIYEGWVDIFRRTCEDPATAAAMADAGVTFQPTVGADSRLLLEDYRAMAVAFMEAGKYDIEL